MAIVLPRGILKNYSDERVRRYILQNTKVLAVVGLGNNMFKPFTNTKTVVLFLQKRLKPLDSENQIEHFCSKDNIAFCVTERSGKDKAGKIVVDANGEIISDLPEITKYLLQNIRFLTTEELEEEYNSITEQGEVNEYGTNG